MLAAQAAPGAETTAAHGGGGSAYVGKPEIAQVRCASGCLKADKVRNGGTVRLKGTKLSYATKVVFLGAHGAADDVAVKVSPSSDRALRVKVPYNARTGPLSAWANTKVRSKPTRTMRIVAPPAPEPKGELSPASGPSDPAGPRIETAVNRGSFYLASPSAMVFSYRIDDSAPDSVLIALVRLTDGATVQSWTADAVPPGQVQEVRWDGRVGGVYQPAARYGFRLTASGASGASSHNVADGEANRDAFELRDNIFPVRGGHNYGNAGARFGAPRSGHTHEGQDVMAKCGTRLVAARGGVVKMNKFHGAAGNYVVIDADGTDVDYMYAHLVSPSPIKAGQHVFTGQQIGNVGQTGDATACHLHFELWSGPGWYSGGAPFDPLPSLRAWDAYS